MCGIAGFAGKEKALSPEVMDSMLSCIAYRGPDDAGQWSEGNLMLGHRRLSILDLSTGGRQPMIYNQRYVLVFNGEIYNYLELRDELTRKGYHFHTETDSEIIPAAYDCWGEDCQNRMNGMWAFALYDREKKNLFCSRDRFGIKPFYYIDQSELFAFGSEIKQLLNVLPGRPQVDGPVLEVFLAGGFLDFSERTMFREIRQLCGGYCLRYDLDTKCCDVHQWFFPDMEDIDCDEEKAKQRFRNLFSDAICRHLRADVEIGSCLSGGLDSSAIVCTVNKIIHQNDNPNTQYAVSACFEQPGYDEREYSHEVQKFCSNLILSEVFPNMDHLIAELDDIIWHMDEPIASSSVFAQREVFRRAKELGLKVMLDGQGADELLAGYTDFYKTEFAWLFRSRQWKRLRKEVDAYIQCQTSLDTNNKVRFFTVTALETIAPCWFQNMLFRLYQRHARNRQWLHLTPEGMDLLWSVKQRFDKRDPKVYTRAEMDIGLRELLHYEDRNSMAFSIEARVPFLDAIFSDFAENVPFGMKIKDGKTKWIMRAALEDTLPYKISHRYDKMGFVTPEALWLKQHLSELEPLLFDAAERLSSWIDKEAFLNWFSDHGTEGRNYMQIWRVLCASEWMKVFQMQIE